MPSSARPIGWTCRPGHPPFAGMAMVARHANPPRVGSRGRPCRRCPARPCRPWRPPRRTGRSRWHRSGPRHPCRPPASRRFHGRLPGQLRAAGRLGSQARQHSASVTRRRSRANRTVRSMPSSLTSKYGIGAKTQPEALSAHSPRMRGICCSGWVRWRIVEWVRGPSRLDRRHCRTMERRPGNGCAGTKPVKILPVRAL